MTDHTTQSLTYQKQTGLCPVCRRRPSAVWPDGKARVTCGDDACYTRWLPTRGNHHATDHHAQATL